MSKVYSYTVGIKKLFGFKKYKNVTNNYYENIHNNVAFGLRLCLEFVDGSELSIGNIDQKDVKIYPDFNEARKQVIDDKMKKEFDEFKEQKKLAKQAPPIPTAGSTIGAAPPNSIQALANQRGISV